MKELAFEYDVAESTLHRTITWVKDILIRSRKFALPSRKVLVQFDSSLEFVLADVTESPIGRPKKTKGLLLWQEKIPHHQNTNYPESEDEKNSLHYGKEKDIYTTFVCSKRTDSLLANSGYQGI